MLLYLRCLRNNKIAFGSWAFFAFVLAARLLLGARLPPAAACLVIGFLLFGSVLGCATLRAYWVTMRYLDSHKSAGPFLRKRVCRSYSRREGFQMALRDYDAAVQ